MSGRVLFVQRYDKQMPEMEFKGKTVAEAINNGLTQLGCNRENAIVKIVNQGSTGLFGLMGAKPAIVLISVNNSKRINKISVNVDHEKACKKA
ncbi:hypothetical protein AGMMS50233_07070 [Endomicrobiia bacterium]|nr:hypothetical protein AGMMS50233_07070 [Endomicrobiia bacterium]